MEEFYLFIRYGTEDEAKYPKPLLPQFLRGLLLHYIQN